MMRQYVHFTDLAGATAIRGSGELWACDLFVSSVFAVPVGGHFCPEVQTDGNKGRAKDRRVAVVFTTESVPKIIFPEEVIWDKKKIKIEVINVTFAATAAKLLDDSVFPYDDNNPQRCWDGYGVEVES